jgi:hypothetical protein
MNEANEIGGDLLNEYEAIQADEYREMNEDAPIVELDEADLEAWFASWLAENPTACPRASQSWIRCPDCQGSH